MSGPPEGLQVVDLGETPPKGAPTRPIRAELVDDDPSADGLVRTGVCLAVDET